MTELLARITAGQDLTREQARTLFDAITQSGLRDLGEASITDDDPNSSSNCSNTKITREY